MIKGFKLVEQSDVLNSLLDYRVNYNDKGVYLGFDNLHEHYSMMLGTCTDWSGFPASGKTQVLMEILLNTSKMYGWRHLIYFPDVGNRMEIVADLLHKLTGKSFNPKFDNHITESEIQKDINWVLHHFCILTKHDVKAKMTPFEFWDMAAQMKNDGIQTASIDSWKDMHHDYNRYGNYAQYLEIVLPYRNQIAEDNELHLNTVIHPKLTETTNGKRNPPTPYDLKGGSEWFNSGKCMATVHRTDDNGVDIIFGKVKPRSVGLAGTVQLRFDLAKFVYYEEVLNGTQRPTRRYAQEKGGIDLIRPETVKPLQPSDDWLIGNDNTEENPF